MKRLAGFLDKVHELSMELLRNLVEDYSCKNMQYRYIQFDEIQVSIGIGFDFLHLSIGKTKKTKVGDNMEKER